MIAAETKVNVKVSEPVEVKGAPQLSVPEAKQLGAALASDDEAIVKAAAETVTQLCYDGPHYDSSESQSENHNFESEQVSIPSASCSSEKPMRRHCWWRHCVVSRRSP